MFIYFQADYKNWFHHCQVSGSLGSSTQSIRLRNYGKEHFRVLMEARKK